MSETGLHPAEEAMVLAIADMAAKQEAAITPEQRQQAIVAANPGLTLLQGYTAISQGSQPDAYQMDDDEREDLDGVKIRPLRLKMDGTTGKFSTTEPESKEWDALDQTVILAPLDHSQVLFPKIDANTKKQIWPEGSTDWPKFICRADSVLGIPRLHPETTDEQKQLALKLKVNGAANEGRTSDFLNCTTCIHARFGPNSEKPNCAAALNLLVFEANTKEPAVLQVKGTSIKGADKHLGSYKRRGRALFSDLVSIGSKQVVDEGTKWRVMTFTPGAEVGVEAAPFFREMRKMMRPLILEEMRSGRNVVLGSDDELTHDEPPPPEPVGDALDPIDPRDPLPDGTPSEFDLF